MKITTVSRRGFAIGAVALSIAPIAKLFTGRAEAQAALPLNELDCCRLIESELKYGTQPEFIRTSPDCMYLNQRIEDTYAWPYYQRDSATCIVPVFEISGYSQLDVHQKQVLLIRKLQKQFYREFGYHPQSIHMPVRDQKRFDPLNGRQLWVKHMALCAFGL